MPFPEPALADPSGKTPQQFTQIGAEWFTSLAVKTSANRPSIATAAPAPPGMKKFAGVAFTPLTAPPGSPPSATLYVSAAVVIAGPGAGATHVTTRLWMHGNVAASGPLYATPKGAEVGRLGAIPAVHAIFGAANNGWTPVEIDGYLAADAPASSTANRAAT